MPINAVSVETVKDFDVVELERLGRFNTRIIAQELGLFVTEHQKAKFMQMDSVAQAKVLFLRLQELKNKKPDNTRADVLEECLAAMTEENRRLGEDNNSLRVQLEAADMRNAELTERMCLLAERVAHVGLAQLESRDMPQLPARRRRRATPVQEAPVSEEAGDGEAEPTG